MSDAFSHPDFDRLQLAVTDAARTVFQRAKADHAHETFFAYVLSTYGSGALGGCAVNTIENHRRVWDKALAQSYTRIEEEPHYKWFCGEWQEFEFVGDQFEFDAVYPLFNKAMETLEALLEQRGRDGADIYGVWEEHPVYIALADALAQLDREGLFGSGETRRNTLVYVAQYDGEPGIERWSIERLNPFAPEILKQEASSV